MNESSSSFRDTWRQVTDELIRLSTQADSGIPSLSNTQRAYLKLVKPIALVNGFAVLSTPNNMAKIAIERDLGEPLTMVLSDILGQPHSLAVSVDPSQEEEPPAPEPQPEPAYEEAPPRSAPIPARRSGLAPGQYIVGGEQEMISFPGQQSPPAPETPQPHQQSFPTESVQHVQEAPPHTRASTSNEGWEPTHTEPGYAVAADAHRPAAPSQTATSAFPRRLPRETPAHNPNNEASLNPKYTFESFVIGSSNRFANAAAVGVAEEPAKVYNPLFIWGGSGLGKTHLLHAIGNYAQFLAEGALRIKYVSSEEFTNDYINSVRDDRQESFKRRYRNLDILMVDDIQFLEGKEGTQEEFFHTFNALHQAGKQIILSSDRPPRQLTTLEDRLRTRFEGGLTTDVQPPDLETRIAILMKKAAADNTQVGRDVLELIASRFESSIRELEGALIRVSAYSSLINQPIDKEMAIIALRDILPEAGEVEVTAESIMEVAADYFKISLDTLRGAGKTRSVAHARQLAMYLCRELTDLSLPKIGDHFGGKDHTTVMYADRKIRKEMTEKRDTYDEIQLLTQMVRSKGRG